MHDMTACQEPIPPFPVPQTWEPRHSSPTEGRFERGRQLCWGVQLQVSSAAIELLVTWKVPSSEGCSDSHSGESMNWYGKM